MHSLSLPPENIRKPYGFQGVEKGCIGNKWFKLEHVANFPTKLKRDERKDNPEG